MHVAKMCVFLVIGFFEPRFRWPSAHCKDDTAATAARTIQDPKFFDYHLLVYSYSNYDTVAIVPLVEGELLLLLIYYRLSPPAGW